MFDPGYVPGGNDIAPPEAHLLTQPPLTPSVDTDALQRLLDKREPTNIPASLASEAIDAAWAWLVGDLAKARWSDMKLLAATATDDGTGDTETPASLTVTLQWSGTNPLGEPVDIRETHIHVFRLADQQIDVLGIAPG